MRRVLVLLLAGWAVLLSVMLVSRWRALPDRVVTMTMAEAERTSVETGDPAWHAMLEALEIYPGSVVVLAADPTRESAWLSYRTAYHRFPRSVRVESVERRPEIVKGNLVVGESVAAWMSLHTGTTLVLWPGLSGKPWTIFQVLGQHARRIRVSALPFQAGLQVDNLLPVQPARRAPHIWLAWVIMLGIIGWRVAMTRRFVSPPEALIGVVMLAVAVVLAALYAAGPQPAWSNWDAWAVWDLKVKAIRCEGWFPAKFLVNPDYAYAHQEYPLGWPWLVALLSADGTLFNSLAARMVSPLFALGLAAALAALVAELGAARYRWIVAGAVALLPLALDQSANGYVDLPLAAIMTAAMVLTIRVCRGTSPAWLVGLVAGIAGNFKNEGLIGGMACLVAIAVNAREGRLRWRDVLTAAIVWLIVSGPWQAVVIHFHLQHFDYGPLTLTAVAAMPHRLLMVVRALLLEMFGAGSTGATWLNHALSSWLLFWPVAALALISGWRRLREPGLREVTLILGIQVVAATLAYTLTRLDVNWLLGSSLDRLLLQWVPGVAALAVAVRGEAVGE